MDPMARIATNLTVKLYELHEVPVIIRDSWVTRLDKYSFEKHERKNLIEYT